MPPLHHSYTYLLTEYSLRCFNMEQLQEGLSASLKHYTELRAPNQQRHINTERRCSTYGRHRLLYPISPSYRSTGLRWTCDSGIENCPRSTSRCAALDVHTICFIDTADGGREAESLYKRLFGVDWKAHGHRSSHLIIQGEISIKSQGEENSWLES